MKIIKNDCFAGQERRILYSDTAALLSRPLSFRDLHWGNTAGRNLRIGRCAAPVKCIKKAFFSRKI